jgi:hypothetical protein
MNHCNQPDDRQVTPIRSTDFATSNFKIPNRWFFDLSHYQMSKLTPSLVAVLLLVAIGTSLAGCAKPVAEKKLVYSATGTLKINGKPAEGAWVTLVPDFEGVPTPTARVTPDGKFLLEVFDQDVKSYDPPGDPEGEYLFLISMPRDPNSRISPDRLGGIYSNPKTAKKKVNIELGENQLAPIAIDGAGMTE